MEISKEKLLSIIKEESTDIPMDEMAKHANPISRPIKDENGALIGHDMRVNPDDEESGRVNVIFTCDIQEFMNSHPELIQKLKEQYGNIKWSDETCPQYRPHLKKREYKPLPGDDDNVDIGNRGYQPSGKKMSEREKILRYSGGKADEGFYNIIRTQLEENEDIKRHLELCSIPEIKTDRTHIDRYAKISNDELTFRTHSFDFYDTPQMFLKAVVSRVKGETPEHEKGQYLSRLFNIVYKNWDPKKKTDKNFFGYTDIYGLKKFGFEEKNINVMVSTTFKIQGNLVGRNGYVWNVSLETKFGKKLQEDPQVKGLTSDKNISVTKEVPEDLDDNRTLNSDFTIMDKLSIKQGLLEALDEFRQKIMEISPKDALKLANLKRYDVQKVDEGKINELIKNVISEFRK